jgi:RimJ/RimL family protein N-acetyltransferase
MNTQRSSAAPKLGTPVPSWTSRPRPPRTPMIGRYCRLEPLNPPLHARDLHEADREDVERRNWTWLTVDPPADFAAYRIWLDKAAAGDDPLFHAIIDAATGRAVGLANFKRIDPGNGVLEVGHVFFAPSIQKTRIGSEAMFLMMQRVFDELGYRRYEWNCDSQNAASRKAAVRYGFKFEGIFRQAQISKGRNRDTVWFSMLDSEWPAIRAAFESSSRNTTWRNTAMPASLSLRQGMATKLFPPFALKICAFSTAISSSVSRQSAAKPGVTTARFFTPLSARFFTVSSV